MRSHRFRGHGIVLRPVSLLSPPMTRVCPRCEAPAGHSCRIRRGKGDGAYWWKIASIHPERRRHRQPSEQPS